MTLAEVIQIGVIIVAGLLLTRFSRPLMVKGIRLIAKRGLERALDGHRSQWKNRLPRLQAETSSLAELRRQQRIEATALGLSRAFNIVVWTLALVLILEAANIDPVYAISAAGFLGVALAIGGQNAVNDFVTGLQLLLEDRMGEGDLVRIQVNDEVFEGQVGALGAFSARFDSETATVHIANRELTKIVNLSQHGVSTEITIADTAPTTMSDLEQQLRDEYRHSEGYDSAIDGLVIDKVHRRGKLRIATIRTARPLTEAQRRALDGVDG